LLGDVRFRSPWRDLDNSIAHVAAEVRDHLPPAATARCRAVEVIRPVFYQISRAYVVGRVVGREFVLPLVIALKNTDSGVLVDAVMLAKTTSASCSASRARTSTSISSVSPSRGVPEVDHAAQAGERAVHRAGRAKQGKTERYRELMRHLEHTGICSRTRPASVAWSWCASPCPPRRRLQVIATASPSKTVLREEVLAKYQMVFIHDRAGRLVDAQEFRRLRFPRARFAPSCWRSCGAKRHTPCAQTARTWCSITCISSGA